MNRKDYLFEAIDQIVKDKIKTQMVFDRLMEEGALSVGYGNAEVDQILTKFSDVFGTTKASRYDRYSANRLASKYGVQAICGIMALLGENSTEPYAPIVNNVKEMEDKMPSILNFLRKLDKGSELDI